MAYNDDFLVNNPSDINPLYLMKKDEELEEDNDTPFSPADDNTEKIYNIHEQIDADTDVHEQYDEGLQGESKANVPKSDINQRDDAIDNDEDDDNDITTYSEVTTEAVEMNNEEE